MSDMVERVATAILNCRIRPNFYGVDEHGVCLYDTDAELARAAIAIVIEDCALVAESESVEGCEWIVAKIAARIRAAPEDSAAQAELDKLCS